MENVRDSNRALSAARRRLVFDEFLLLQLGLLQRRHATGRGGIVEIQGTAEDKPFTQEQFLDLLVLARQGIATLTGAQQAVLAA